MRDSLYYGVGPGASQVDVKLLIRMAYVVTEACIKCKYTDCVDVCPVDCFREGPNMLVIDPDECIDCTLCVPECPVEAIFSAMERPMPRAAPVTTIVLFTARPSRCARDRPGPAPR